MLELVIIDTRSGSNRRVPLEESSVILGSDIGCDVVLPGEGVSPRHCRFEQAGDTWRVVDLDSEGGVSLNDQWVGRAKVKAGDALQIGAFRLVVAGDTAAAPPAAAPPPVAAPVPPPAPAPVAPAAPPPAPAPPEPEPQRIPKSSSSSKARRRPAAATAAREPRESGARRPRREKGDPTAGLLILVALLALVGGAAFFLTDSGEAAPSVNSAILNSAMAQATDASDRCAFDDALSELDIVARRYGKNPQAAKRISGLREQVERRRDKYAVGTKAVANAAARGDAGDPAGAASELRRLSSQYAELMPLRDQAESLAAKFEAAAPAPRAPRSIVVTDPTNVSRWVADIDKRMNGGDYAGALTVLHQLRPGGSGDVATLERTWSRLQAGARAAAANRIRGIEHARKQNNHFVVLNHFREDDLRKLRGTDVWHELMDIAEEVEDKVDSSMPAAARPVSRRKHQRPREPKPSWGTDQGRASAPSVSPQEAPGRVADAGGDAVDDAGRSGVSALASGARDEAEAPVDASWSTEELTLRGREAFLARDYAHADAWLSRALEGTRDPVDRMQLEELLVRAGHAIQVAVDVHGWFAETDSSRWPQVTLRGGERADVVRMGDDIDLVVTVGGDERTVAATDLEANDLLKLSARLRKQEHAIDRAWLALECEDEKVFLQCVKKLGSDDEWKPERDDLIARWKGLDLVPDDGFFLVAGTWMTGEEQLAHELKVGLADALKRLARGDDGARDALDVLHEKAPSAVIDALVAQMEALAEKAVEFPERERLASLHAERATLDEARQHALDLIYDSDKYFYPYRPPQVSSERAQEYMQTQLEVERRTRAVRDLWGYEHAEFKGASVALGSKTRDLMGQVFALRDLLEWFGGPTMEDDERLRDLFLLPRTTHLVNLRNVALTLDERRRLDRDEVVKSANAAVTFASSAEISQLLVTNDYRTMLGRQRMAFNEKIHAAARWHADWMTRTGKFGHFEEGEPDRRSPTDRMRAEGYQQGAGENCAISGGAVAAHGQWIRSSGHHRNLLYASHTEAGVGASGRYWVQNFGGGSEFTGNLTD